MRSRVSRAVDEAIRSSFLVVRPRCDGGSVDGGKLDWYSSAMPSHGLTSAAIPLFCDEPARKPWWQKTVPLDS
jgi:hypothetical protein